MVYNWLQRQLSAADVHGMPRTRLDRIAILCGDIWLFGELVESILRIRFAVLARLVRSPLDMLRDLRF